MVPASDKHCTACIFEGRNLSEDLWLRRAPSPRRSKFTLFAAWPAAMAGGGDSRLGGRA